MSDLVLRGMIEVEGMRFYEIEGGFGQDRKAMLAKDIAEIHKRELKDINRRINDNRQRFRLGIDIIDLKKLSGSEALSFESIGYSKQSVANANNIYLMSERGYAKLLKILEDDVAWEQYDKLVDNYFNMRTKTENPYVGMSTELKAIIMQDQKIQVIEQRVDKIENVMTIDYGQQEALRKTVSKRATELLGGKDSDAYKQISKKVFSAVWEAYKERFNVSSYKDTPVTRFKEAQRYLTNWNPDYNLQLEIQGTNSSAAV